MLSGMFAMETVLLVSAISISPRGRSASCKPARAMPVARYAMPYAARTAHATPVRAMGGTGLLADRHPVGRTAPHRRIAARERVEVHDLDARVRHGGGADV